MNNYCTNCCANLGENSTRQLCNKTYCDISLIGDIEIIRINIINKYYDKIKYYNKIINKYIKKFKSNNNNKIYIKFIRYYDKKIYNIYKKINKIY